MLCGIAVKKGCEYPQADNLGQKDLQQFGRRGLDDKVFGIPGSWYFFLNYIWALPRIEVHLPFVQIQRQEDLPGSWLGCGGLEMVVNELNLVENTIGEAVRQLLHNLGIQPSGNSLPRQGSQPSS